MNNALPYYLAIGVPEVKFWDSSPNDLKPYVKAYKMRLKIHDQEQWQNGMYTLSALQTALSKSFNKHSKAKYVEKPLLEKAELEGKKKELSEDEIKRQRELLLASLQIMQLNFENSKLADEENK